MAAPLFIFGSSPCAVAAVLTAERLGFEVRWIAQPAPKSPQPDPRSWSLLPASLSYLRDLGVALPDQAPVQSMAVWHADDQGLPLAGRLDFTAKPQEIISAIVPAAPLRAAMAAATDLRPEPTNLCNPLGLSQDHPGALAILADASWHLALPRAQQSRQTGWAYDQVALSGTVTLDAPHENRAHQVFLPKGPLALLPLPDPQKASLIWSLPPAKAEAMATHGDLSTYISKRLGLTLRVRAADLAQFPLSAAHSRTYGGQGFVLVGDAAHRVHPLAGQGLNLGLHDVAAVFDTLVEARRLGSDLTSALTLEPYVRTRRPQNEAMIAATDQLARIFGQQAGPLRFLRSLGMDLVNTTAIKPLIQAHMSDPRPLCHALQV